MIVLTGFGDEIGPDIIEQMDVMASEGVKHIELRGVDNKSVMALSQQECADLKKKLDDQGFGISAIGSPIGKVKIDDDFDAHMDDFKHALELAKFFESFVWSIMGSVTGVIWDGGRIGAEIDRSEAVLDERLAAYGQALLTALVEVESSLALERLQGDRIRILELQVATAKRTLQSARRRFGAGIGSYIAVLTALRSLQAAEQTWLTSKRRLLSQRVQLYRALGSRWTAELEPPGDDEEDAS